MNNILLLIHKPRLGSKHDIVTKSMNDKTTLSSLSIEIIDIPSDSVMQQNLPKNKGLETRHIEPFRSLLEEDVRRPEKLEKRL